MEMKKSIYDLVKRGSVSFVELSKIDGFKGNLSMELDDKNIILWDGISKEFLHSLEELMKEKRIYLKSTTILVYMADGAMLRLPIANSLRKYKNPRWLPVVFNHVPLSYGLN